jgi:hypothetical protein
MTRSVYWSIPIKDPAKLLCAFLNDWCDEWKKQNQREWSGVSWTTNGPNDLVIMKGARVAAFDVSFLPYSTDKAVYIQGFLQDVEKMLVDWLPKNERWLAAPVTKRPKGWRLFGRCH